MPAWESCFFRFFWECEEAGSSDFAQVALSEKVLGQRRFQPSAAIDPPVSNI